MAAAQPAPAKPVVGKEPAPAKPTPYKNRLEMLDDVVNLLEEGADRDEVKQSLQNAGIKWEDIIAHGRKRGSPYFKQQAPMATPAPALAEPSPTGEIKATPEKEFFSTPYDWTAEAIGNTFKRVDASLGDVATSYLLQTGVTDADGAGRLLARNAKQRAAAAPSQAIRAGMEEIGSAETYGEAISALASNPRATFTMLVESLAVSLPGMVPSLVLGPAGVVARSTAAGLSSGGLEYGSVMADVLQDKGVNMLDANAVSKALSDPKIMEEIKEKGAKRGLIVGAFDALSMGMAGRFLKPAQALIAEGKLAGAAAKKATMAAWGKELATQMAGGAGGELAAQKATGENKPADVLLEAVAEGMTAPLEARSNLREAKLAEQEAAINAELAAGKKVTPEQIRADRIAALTEILRQQGIPIENAGNIAARKVDAELKAEAKTAAIKIPEGRVAQITQDLIAAGVDPQQARLDAEQLAQEEAQADELAQAETGGTANVRQPVVTPSGESVSVAGQPDTEPPAGGAGVADTGGVDVAGQNAPSTAGGEGTKPTTLEERLPPEDNKPPEAKSEKADESWKNLGQVQRYEEPGVGRATTDKPHGIYTTPANVESPHKDLGGERSTWDVNPNANVLDVTPLAGPDVAMRQSAVGAGAGVAAAKKLLGAEHFELLKGMGKDVLVIAANVHFPDVDFSKYYDAQEVMEALGAQLAKKAGYDAIWQADKDPAFSEFVALTDNAMTPTETKGADLGTETTEAVEATQEGQEAPATGAVKGKRGRKAAPAEVKEQKKLTRNEQNRINNDADYKLKKYTAQLEQTLTPEQIEELSLEEAEQAEIDARQSRRSALRGLLELQGNPNIARGSAVGKRISAALKASKATEAELADIRRGMKAAEEVLTGPKEDVLGGVATSGVSGKTEAKVNKSSDVKVGKADTGFSKLTNGSQAIAHILKTGNLFQRFVAQRIRNFVVGVKFVVVEKGDGTPAKILSELSGARGLFVYTPGSKERTIYVRGASFGDQQGINVITVLHELLHAATASRIEAGLLKGFRNASLQKFMREMESLMKKVENEYHQGVRRGTVPNEVQDLVETGAENVDFDSRGRPKFEIFNNPHEFLAYGMSSPEFQKFLMSVQGTRGTGFSGFVSSIRDLFGVKASDATAFTDLVDITDKMLGTRRTAVQTKGGSLQQKGKFTPPEFDEQADIKAKRSALQLTKDVKIAKEKVRLSREGELTKNVELMQLARDPKAVREILANAVDELGYKKLQASVLMPTFDFLAKWADDVGISALKQTNTQLQRMLGMSQQFLAGAEQVIGSLNRGFKEDPNLSREKFSDFVYATTLAEVDPSDPNFRDVEVERKEKKTKKGAKPQPKTTTLAADYKALGPVGQRMYKQLRDYYEAVIELYSDLLDEQINGIQGMAPEEKKNLMAILRKTFESEARIKPFFPLVRRGDYWLAIGKDENRLFYLFETRAERNAKAKELAAGRGEDYEDALFRQEFTQGNDLNTLRAASQNASEMLKKVFEAIDAKDLGSPSAKEGLKDAIYQIYLTTMPEQSFRRQFTHRKGRAGFSTDLQRNIATTASKQSIQLARLKYAPQLRLSLSAARDSIREREELSPFVQEAEKRIDMALSGDHGSLSEAVAGVANKASYFWYLSSAASALIQPSSVFISGLPVLAGNYNNATGAAAELAKMTTLVNQYSVFRTNVDGKTSISAPSIANNKSLPEDERKAISEMTARGVSESTYASLVWGYKSMSTERFEGVVGKGKRLANLMVGALMHNTERLSREAVYLAAYRLGRKQGLDYDAAVQKAVDSTNEALGNYDVTNRPRYMQQGIGKIAFQFKTYPLQMSLLLLTNFKKMIPFLNKEGKKEAATKFFGMLGTSYLLAGAANMALFSPIMGLAGWAWSQMGLDDDWPEELKDIDFETWFRTVFLPEKLGDVTLGGVPVSDIVDRGPLNAITGYDIGSRIGLNDLWGRDSKETKTSRESAIAFMLDHFGGPTASLLLGFADAYDAYALGDYQKMLEKMLPAAARNLVVANKYADEGMKTARGKELVSKDDVKTGELIGQAIGFRPDILAVTQGPSFKLTGIDQKINNQRNLLLNKLDFNLRKDTPEGIDKFNEILADEVTKFNIKYPTYKLDGESIKNSLREKAKQRESSRAGVNVTKKNIVIVEEAVSTLEDRLDKRAMEMAKRRAEKNPR
jgi:hypothetical protein